MPGETISKEAYQAERAAIKAEMKGLVEQVIFAKTGCRRARSGLKTVTKAVRWGVNLPASQREAALLKNRIRFLHQTVVYLKTMRKMTIAEETRAEDERKARPYAAMDAIDEHNGVLG